MARKRLNVKFIILGVAAFVVLGAAATTYKFRKRLFYNPDKLMVEGKKFLAEGNADEAAKRFYEVGGIRGGGDPELYVLLGDVHDLKAGEDPDNHLRKAYGFWQNALSVDPRYLPALHRLLDRSLEVVAIEPRNSAYQGLRDAAQRLLVVDPEDKKAQYALHMATVQLKLTGGQVDQSAVDESIKALEKRFAEDPDDADAMYHVAVAKLHRAQDAYGSNDDTTMRNLMNEVVAMQDTAVQARPGNAALHLRSAQTSLHLASLELVTRNDPKKWIERAMQFATKARELAKPGEKYFRDIHHLYAKMLRDDRKIDEAEQVLREVLKLDPNDQMTKIALAETIGANPKRREEAVKLLTEPPPAPKTLKGIAAATAKHMEAAALMTLLDIKLDELELAKTPEERQQGLAYVEEKFNRLKSMIGDRPDVMSVWGRIQMSKGDVAGAVQTFSTALRSAEQMSSHNRLRTKAMLAHGYTMTGQSGQAKREYAELLRMTDTPGGNEGTIPQRIRLVELLLAENNVEEARPHV